jgi:hypothetical protein
MWRRFRAILLSHSVASWFAMSALWAYQLLCPGMMPQNSFHDPKFWLIFSVTEIGAPVVVPWGFFLVMSNYRAEMFSSVAIPSGAYAVMAVLFLRWWWHRQNAIVARARLKSGQCLVCGYDLRATPDRCPECGAVRLEKQNSQT